MKNYFLFCMGLIVNLMPANCFAKTTSNDADNLSQVVINYGDALSSLCASSREFGADSETEWAIDTVNIIWNSCKVQPFDLLQYMASISLMQSYFAYGVDYVPLTFYWSKHYAETQAGENTYKNYFDEDRHFVDAFYSDVRDKHEGIDYFIMNAYSLNMLDLYFALYDDLNGRDTEPHFASLYNLDYINQLYKNQNVNLMNYAWQLDGASFFITYCTWIRRTAQDPNEPQMMSVLVEFAQVFDKHAKPIRAALDNGTQLPSSSEADVQAYLLETLPIKTQMLKLLETNIKNIK